MNRKTYIYIILPIVVLLILLTCSNYITQYVLIKNSLVEERKAHLKELAYMTHDFIEHFYTRGDTIVNTETELTSFLNSIYSNEADECFLWILKKDSSILIHTLLPETESYDITASGEDIMKIVSTDGEGFLETGGILKDISCRKSVLSYLKYYKDKEWILGVSTCTETVNNRIREIRQKQLAMLIVFFMFVLFFITVLIIRAVKDEKLRKEAEVSLKNSEERFRNLFHMSNDIITITDYEGHILDINHRSLEQYNITLEDLRKRTIWEMIPAKYHAIIAERRSLMNKTKLEPLEIELYLRYDFALIVEAKSSTMTLGGKEFILSSMRDVTSKKIADKQLLNASIAAEEKERSRIAKELHDGLGPFLSTIKLYFQWLGETNEENKRNIIIEKGNRSIEEAITVLREVSNNLNPHILTNYGLMDAISAFIKKFELHNDLQINFQPFNEFRLSSNIEIMLYRIVIELLNNTIKHAEATDVQILFEKIKAGSLKLSYIDNGKGFDVKRVKRQMNGIGLVNITKRVESLNGEVKIKSTPGKGMSVLIVVEI